MPTQQKQIGDAIYTVTPLPAMRSFTLQPRLAPAVAEVAASIFDLKTEIALKKKDGETDLLAAFANTDVSELISAVSRFFLKLPPDELEAITRELLSSATRNGTLLFVPAGAAVGVTAHPFDVQMQGKTMEIWQLLWFAVEVNYPDFFGQFADSVGAVKGESGSPTSNT